MAEAIEIVWYIYEKFIDLVFNKLDLFQGVNLGWVFIGLIIFTILIKSVIAAPKTQGNFKTIERVNKNDS